MQEDKSQPDLVSMLKTPAGFFALGFGTGLSPFAPGTVATVAAIPLCLLLHELPTYLYFIVVVVFFLLGIWLCEQLNRRFDVHDHGAIVWDEIVGFLIAMLWVSPTIITVTVGFVLFRFFDILKPWPIGYLDKKISGGSGVMLDDVLAGIYTNLCLQLMIFKWF